MTKKYFWLSITAVVLSFLGGFLLANALNRAEIDQLRAENGRLKAASESEPAEGNPQFTLSPEELREKIEAADRDPGNIEHQKNLGFALYAYAAMKEDAELLSDVIRLLERAHKADKDNFDVIVTLGNAYYDAGNFKKEDGGFEKARRFYEMAAGKKPDHPAVVELHTKLEALN